MNDLPGALMNRWVAWIRSFDFTVRHIRGTQNVVADALSRRPITKADLQERDRDGDMDEFVDCQIHLNEIRDQQSVLDANVE